MCKSDTEQKLSYSSGSNLACHRNPIQRSAITMGHILAMPAANSSIDPMKHGNGNLKQHNQAFKDCRVAALLAMTDKFHVIARMP